MNVHTGNFPAHDEHHRGWFRVFRFSRGVEIWLGSKWISVDWA